MSVPYFIIAIFSARCTGKFPVFYKPGYIIPGAGNLTEEEKSCVSIFESPITV
jgi:hypothetical protein